MFAASDPFFDGADNRCEELCPMLPDLTPERSDRTPSLFAETLLGALSSRRKAPHVLGNCPDRMPSMMVAISCLCSRST